MRMKKSVLVILIGISGVLGIILFLYTFPPAIKIKNVGSVTVTGRAEIQKLNEIAQFSAGVNAVYDKKEDAIDEVNTKMSDLISTVKKFGVSPKDIKTQNLNIYQNQESYYEDGRQKQRMGQWNVSNTLEITLRNVQRADELAKLLSESGANNIFGPSFSLDSKNINNTDVTALAVQDAKKKAETLVKSSGTKLGRILTIAEREDDPYMYYKGGGGGGGGANIETETGSTTVTKIVTVTFELE